MSRSESMLEGSWNTGQLWALSLNIGLYMLDGKGITWCSTLFRQYGKRNFPWVNHHYLRRIGHRRKKIKNWYICSSFLGLRCKGVAKIVYSMFIFPCGKSHVYMEATIHWSTAMMLHITRSAILPGSGTTASLESQCMNYNIGKLFFNEFHCEVFCTELYFIFSFLLWGDYFQSLRKNSPPLCS